MRKIGKNKTPKGKELILAAQSALQGKNSLSPDFKTAIDGLINFTGILLDHLGVSSSNSNLPELERAFEQDGQKWAKRMQKLLIEIKVATEMAGGCLSEKQGGTGQPMLIFPH